jgi:hypothetical protein
MHASRIGRTLPAMSGSEITPEVIAQWMLDELEREQTLHQERAVE